MPIFSLGGGGGGEGRGRELPPATPLAPPQGVGGTFNIEGEGASLHACTLNPKECCFLIHLSGI